MISRDNEATTQTVAPGARRVVLERRDAADLPYPVFLRDYVARNRPLVVEHAFPACPAQRQWTPQYFRERFGSREVQVSPSQKMAFAAFVDAVLASTEAAPGPYMYRLFIGRTCQNSCRTWNR